MENRTKEEIIEIIEKHLKAAEADLEKCRRGSNWGRVNALRDLVNELNASREVKS